jgi:hypothetical protein
MNEICIVPAYNREELLWLCLEAIRKADSEIALLVTSDKGADSDDLSKTCAQFHATELLRERHDAHGNSFNVLETLRYAAGKFDLIHIVEEDTIIHPGWFAWARTQLGLPPQLSGQNRPTRLESGKEGHSTQEPNLYAAVCARIHGDRSTVWYDAPCASWNATYLRQALAMIPDGYLTAKSRNEMTVLADATFPNSRYRYGSGEQDGFLLRCIEHFKWQTKFPEKAMAQHLGFFGYNQPVGRDRPTGTLEERVAFCRQLLADKRQRTELFGQRITELEMEGAAQ